MIYHGDCLEYLRRLDGRVKCFWADPPDNIGLSYNGFADKWDRPEHYYDWIRLLVLEALPRCDIFWLCYNATHELEITHILRDILRYRHPSWKYDKFIWRYTFSQYNDADCAYGYRPFVRLWRGGPSGTVKMYPDKIREVSGRQELGDSRAAGPRVPDNVWPIPRVVGNTAERVTWMPTQIPIRLMERIISFSIDGGDSSGDSSGESSGEELVDLFGGSGSAIKAAIKLGKGYAERVHCVEIDLETCERIKESVGSVIINQVVTPERPGS